MILANDPLPGERHYTSLDGTHLSTESGELDSVSRCFSLLVFALAPVVDLDRDRYKRKGVSSSPIGPP
jgi:hypothetical protein